MVGGVGQGSIADEGREGRSDVSTERLARVESRTPSRAHHRGRLRRRVPDRASSRTTTWFWGVAESIRFATFDAILDLGKHYCDISFMPEDAWELDEKAVAAGVIAVVDCGVAPGMSNLQAGLAARHLDPCHSIDIMVGGIPRDPKPPWNYKAGFSPFDVVEESLRPSASSRTARWSPDALRNRAARVRRRRNPGGLQHGWPAITR